MRNCAAYLLAGVLAGSGCQAVSPLAPDGAQGAQPLSPPESAAASLSGWVYATVEWGDPPIADAVVRVEAADGSVTTTVSDVNGFYALSVPGGARVVSITT